MCVSFLIIPPLPLSLPAFCSRDLAVSHTRFSLTGYQARALPFFRVYVVVCVSDGAFFFTKRFSASVCTASTTFFVQHTFLLLFSVSSISVFCFVFLGAYRSAIVCVRVPPPCACSLQHCISIWLTHNPFPFLSSLPVQNTRTELCVPAAFFLSPPASAAIFSSFTALEKKTRRDTRRHSVTIRVFLIPLFLHGLFLLLLFAGTVRVHSSVLYGSLLSPDRGKRTSKRIRNPI